MKQSEEESFFQWLLNVLDIETILKIFVEKAGKRIYIPAKRIRKNHWLEQLDKTIAEHILTLWGGFYYYVPIAFKRYTRNQLICADADKMSSQELATKYKLSTRQIQNIIKNAS
jgi:Mor family transcriptional regulator